MFKTGEMLSDLWGKERDLMEDNCRQPISGPTPKSRTLRFIHTGTGQPIFPVAGVFPREGAPRPASRPSATLAALSIPLLSRTHRPPEIKGFPVLPAAPPRPQSLLRLGNARDSQEKSFCPRWRLNSPGLAVTDNKVTIGPHLSHSHGRPVAKETGHPPGNHLLPGAAQTTTQESKDWL